MAIARRFFPAPHTAFSLAELAQIAEAELKSGDSELKLADIAPLAEAKPNELSFFTNAKNRKALQETKAGAIIAPLYVAQLTNKPLLVTNNPRLGFALVAQRFYPAITDHREATGGATEASTGKGGATGAKKGTKGAKGLGDATQATSNATGAKGATGGATEATEATGRDTDPTQATGGTKRQRVSPPKIDPTATVHPSALVEEGARIGPHCHIGYGSYIGHNCQLGKGVVISEQVRISHSVIGDGAVIHSHTSVGEEGFGFAVSQKGEYVTLPHLGKVTIGARTVIASGCTIIRGTMADTIIGEDCRLDTQIQVAHNVVLGRGVIISAQVGISGSTSIGDYTRIGGHVGIMGHLQIGSRVSIFPKSGVMENIADGMQVGGAPAIPLRDFLKYARRRK